MLLFDVGFIEIQGMATVVIFGILFYLLTELKTLRREIGGKKLNGPGNNALTLQAYERLTLFAERISLKNLVNRMHNASFSAQELQAGLIESIRNEYDHNITQQNYVNPEVWKAITNLKEQNIYIINQLATTLPAHATSLDLGRIILGYISNNNAELSAIVLDAIQYEVKKLI